MGAVGQGHGFTFAVNRDIATEQLHGKRSAPTVKQHLACIRMLFDWLVIGQVIPVNPAHSAKGDVWYSYFGCEAKKELNGRRLVVYSSEFEHFPLH